MTNFTTLLRSAAALALMAGLSAPVLAQDTAPAAVNEGAAQGHATMGTFGLDLTAGDSSVKPGDDWIRYTSGKWLDATVIPADRSSTGPSRDLTEKTRVQVQDLIAAAPADSAYGAFYKSFMDEAKVEALGLAPLKADLAKVAAIKTKPAFAHYMGETAGRFGIALFDWAADSDPSNPSTNVLWLGQGGIGMPDRDYYTAPQFAAQRDAYKAYLQRTFAAIGNPDPKGAAAKVFAFESAVAKASWDRASRRDLDKINNPMSSAQLQAYAPGIDWNTLLAGDNVGPQDRIIVNENTAVRDLAKLYAATPLETLKLWEEFHIASQASPYLNKAMVDSQFEYAKTLTGVPTNLARWKRGVALVSGQMGELVGRDYVAKYFPPAAKAKITELVANLKSAMGDRIRANTWMSEATKNAALVKLAKMDVMVGYPDKWRDFSGLTIRPDDLYGNVQRATEFNHAYDMADLGKPVDRKKWGMSPQTVNAYNSSLENKIVFPAAELQAPHFDPNADDAVNYGAIGAIIGHEISHGFDDQGRKIDETGAMHDWWTAEDATRFDAQAKRFGEQYAKFEPIPGGHVNPELTMGENIADLAGLQAALAAYHKSLGGKPAPVIDGLTGDQRFFLAYAQAWRTKMRDSDLRDRLSTDPHSPDLIRSVAPLRDMDAWYAAFNIQPGDKLYVAPEDRVRLW